MFSQKQRSIFCCLLFVFLFSSAPAESAPTPIHDKKAPIDKIISRFYDLDGDGREERLELHVSGKNFNSPFKWEFKIYAGKSVIYTRSGENERIEKFFSDPNYIGNCSGYDDCKYKWYFNDFINGIVVKITKDNVGIFDRKAPNSIYVIAKENLKKEFAINPKLVEQAIDYAVERLLSGKAVAIVVYDEPYIVTPPMVWMPEFNKFVPIYED